MQKIFLKRHKINQKKKQFCVNQHFRILNISSAKFAILYKSELRIYTERTRKEIEKTVQKNYIDCVLKGL